MMNSEFQKLIGYHRLRDYGEVGSFLVREFPRNVQPILVLWLSFARLHSGRNPAPRNCSRQKRSRWKFSIYDRNHSVEIVKTARSSKIRQLPKRRHS
jgi:hypothetical protein